MMQLSYAQNLEDFHLDLLFPGRQNGTYVDVGGGHPVADNVSFHFYLKGWRGLVVEPQEALAEIYAGVRPRDHAVCCLAGREQGEIDFHVVERLHGFSTTVRNNADGAKQYGASFATIRKLVRPLSDLIEEAGLGSIDFLKIDVEGAEGDVIAGIDFDRHRPRVVVVEAIEPGTMAVAWEAWEPILLERGYQFSFFDRLNRFYVANEAEELRERFPAEPARWDCVQHLWDYGRAPLRPDHPDHFLAQVLLHGFLARLPTLEDALLQNLIAAGLAAFKGQSFAADVAAALAGVASSARGSAAPPTLAEFVDSDELRAALGRIACAYDGGHLMD